MQDFDRKTLLKTNPERYATTGLDWGNPAHYDEIENGLFQALLSVLARRQGLRGREDEWVLRYQQARLEQRLTVIERALWRKSSGRPSRMDDGQVILALEKMADALEIGAEDWVKQQATNGSQVFAGSMLGIAVGFAASVRGHRAGERFSVGPFGGLTMLGMLVTSPGVMVEMEDLPDLAALVDEARRIGVGRVVEESDKSSEGFRRALRALEGRMGQRALAAASRAEE